MGSTWISLKGHEDVYENISKKSGVRDEKKER